MFNFGLAGLPCFCLMQLLDIIYSQFTWDFDQLLTLHLELSPFLLLTMHLYLTMTVSETITCQLGLA